MTEALTKFQQGRYHEIVDDLQDMAQATSDDRVALIGANCFLGQIEKGLELWRAGEGLIEREGQVKCRFFIGTAYARIARFKRARHFFNANMAAGDSPFIQAYAYQGLGGRGDPNNGRTGLSIYIHSSFRAPRMPQSRPNCGICTWKRV